MLENDLQGGHYLETRSIGSLILKFSIPAVISLVVNSLYNIVDQIFIGRGVGYIGNAATNVAFPFVVITVAIALMLGDGCASHLSIRLGEKEFDKARKGIGSTIILLVISGLLFFAVGSIFINPLLRFFGATPSVYSYAYDYLSVILVGTPFFMIATGLNSIIRADGSPRYSMLSLLAGAVINTILDPVFIFVFHWGVKGAAWATVIGQFVSFIISACHLLRFKSFSFSRRDIKLNFSVSKTISAYGISSFITQMAIAVVIIAMNNTLIHYGNLSVYGKDIPLSALGVVMKVNQIMISILVGIGIGAQPILGYNYGAKNFTRVRKCYFMVVTAATIVAFLSFLVFQLFPQSIINLFGQEDGLYNEFALKCFHIFLKLCFLAGFQITSSIFFQAIGKPIKSAALSLSRQILFFIPFLLIIPQFYGLQGVLYVGPLADGCAFLFAASMIFLTFKTLGKTEKKESIVPEPEQA